MPRPDPTAVFRTSQIKCAEEFLEPLFADRLVVIDPLCSLIWIRGRKRTSPITQHDIVILKDSLHVFFWFLQNQREAGK